MAKRSTTTQPATRATRTAVVPVTDTAVAVVPEPVVVVVPEPSAYDIMAERAAMAFPDVAVVPPIVIHMAVQFAAVAHMPVVTYDDRDAVRAAIVAGLESACPGTAVPVKRNVGRFFGNHVFETQNAMYVAAVVSGVRVTDGHFVAGWSAELPIAKCPFLIRVSYPSSTLSEYVAPVPRHNAVPGLPGARAVVVAWMAVWPSSRRNRVTA